MEEVNNILNPKQNNNWEENDNFASKTLEKGEGIVKDVIDGAKETFDLAVEEAKTVAPDVVEVFEESSERLNSKDRITKLMPNNYLVFGAIILTSYFIVKKVL